MASIYKPSRVNPVTGKREKSRRWRIAYRDENGRRIRVAAFTDRGATQQLAAKLEKEVVRRRVGLIDQHTESAVRLIIPTIAEYIAELRRQSKSEAYVKNTERFLIRIANATRWSTIGSVQPESLRKFLQSLAKTNRGHRTQNAYRSAAIALLNWIVAQGWLPANPLNTVAKLAETRIHRKRPRRAFTEAELRSLFAVAPASRQLVYLTAALTGFRRRDLARLHCGDAVTTTDTPKWNLRAEAVKERRDAVLPMAPELVKPLRELIADRGRAELLFTSVPTLRTLKRDMKAAKLVRIGEDRRQLDWHSFRYFAAVTWAKTLPLVKVKTLMRHADIRQTANLYAELGLQDIGDDIWTLPALFTA